VSEPLGDHPEDGVGLKDILVLVDLTDETSNRLRLALDLASPHGSRLTAFYASQWSEDQLNVRRMGEMGLVSAKALDDMVRCGFRRSRPPIPIGSRPPIPI
jgi:hypothetical protein